MPHDGLIQWRHRLFTITGAVVKRRVGLRGGLVDRLCWWGCADSVDAWSIDFG
jgi:hypothetical protein